MKQGALDPTYHLYSNMKYPRLFRWLRIILFQAVATILLTYGIMCSQYVSPPFPKPDDYQPITNPFHSIFCSASLFLCMSFAGQLTGGHVNPAVSLVFLLSKGNKVTPLVFTAYLFSQYIGAMLGCVIGYFLISNFDAPTAYINGGDVGHMFRELAAQIFGMFLYGLFIMIIINEKTTFLRSNFWNYILIPITFYIARQVSQQIDGLNPATVLALQIFYGIKTGDWTSLQTYWVYFFGPFLASLMCAFFFNYFYLPLFIRWKAKK